MKSKKNYKEEKAKALGYDRIFNNKIDGAPVSFPLNCFILLADDCLLHNNGSCHSYNKHILFNI